MIQTHKQLKNFVNNYNKFVNGQYGQIQKIYSTPHLICIILRLKGTSKYLYLGRGNHFEGIWEHMGPPPSEFRVRGRFLEYLRKYLIGARVGTIFLSSFDRILVIPYFQNKDQNFLAFFWKGRTLYFLNQFKAEDKNKIFCSWVGHEEVLNGPVEEKNIEAFFAPLGVGQADLEKEGSDSSILDYFQKLNKDLERISFSSTKKKFFERKEKKIQSDLEKLKVSQKIKEFLDNPGFLIGDKKEIILSGVKFKFEKSLNEYKKRGLIFDKLKGFKKGETVLEKRLKETKKERADFEKQGEKKGIEGINIIEPFWSLKKETLALKTTYKVDYFETKDGLKLAIGKDTQANDFLRTKWANKDDFWFHLEGHKSGHLVVKGNLKFDQELFCHLGSLLRDYAKEEINEIPLIYTKVKNIKGLKGKSGAVTHNKAKYLKVAYRKNWPEFIFKI